MVSPHEALISRTRMALDSNGNWQTTVQAWVHLENGLNFWDAERQGWFEAQPEIHIVPGGASVTTGQQRVHFAPTLDDPAGSISLTGPSGERLRGAFLGLTYLDPVSGQRANIGLVRDVQGELRPPNEVIYPDAIEGISASLRYVYKRSGLEQYVVLHTQLPLPEAYGLRSETARLEALFEVYEATRPNKTVRVLSSIEDPVLRGQVAVPDWFDEQLDFGSFQMGSGRVFVDTGQGSDENSGSDLPVVGKQWVEDGNRIVLIESADFFELLPKLEALPPPPGQARMLKRPNLPEHWVAKKAPLTRLLAQARTDSGPKRAPELPTRRLVQRSRPSTEILLAAHPRPARPSVSIDWSTVSTLTNFTFKGDTTYWVPDLCQIWNNCTIEGGTVIKFAKLTNGVNNPQLLLNPTNLGSITFDTARYLPAVLTAEDDNTVGETVKSGTPSSTATYASSALNISGVAAANPKHLRISYADTAIQFSVSSPSGITNTLRHAQIVKCKNVVDCGTGNRGSLENVLVDDVRSGGYVFKGQTANCWGQHLTVHKADNLRHANITLTLTNCLLVAVTNIQSYSGAGNAESSSAIGLFQSVGAGNFYLAAGSSHRGAGVTPVSTTLATDLPRLTTYAPLLLNAAFTVDTVLTPQALRDTGALDRGYPYEPIDYLSSALSLTNGASLTLTGGVAVAVSGTVGTTLHSGSRFVSEGYADTPNRLCRVGSVQEQPGIYTNSASTMGLLGVPATSPATLPSIRLRHTQAALLANTVERRRLLDAYSQYRVDPLSVGDCELLVTTLYLRPQGDSRAFTVAITNSILDRTDTTLHQGYSGDTASFTVNLRNNLFRDCNGYLANASSGPTWTFRDNLFERLTWNGTLNQLTTGYNGYYSTVSFGGSSNVTLGNVPDYVTGPLGSFYYPTNGTRLALLLDVGSRNGDAAGLYHHTLRTDLVKETNSVVDIGRHWVATDVGGIPKDTDGDGIPDYLEDRDGDGAVDSADGETDWAQSAGGSSSSPWLSTFTPLR